MPYFHISHGLRGCYADGEGYVLKADTRRELKNAIEYAANNYKDAGYIGANKRAVSWLAAIAWRERKKFQLPYVMPLAPNHAKDNYAFGVFVSSASRDEYLEYVKENN